jgi:hypothetical protein
VEIIVGTASASLVASQVYSGTPMPSFVAGFFGILAALYVIVRGLDNVYQALQGTAKASWERLFFGKLVVK